MSASVWSQKENFDEMRKTLKHIEKEEELLKDNPSRWVILPLKYHDIWDMFKKHETSFWTAEDFVFSEEIKNEEFKNFKNDNILAAIQNLITFAVLADPNIYGNGSVRSCEMLEKIQAPEARAFYGFECAFEVIHLEIFNQLFVFFCSEKQEKDRYKRLNRLLLNMMDVNVVKKKKDWVESNLFGERSFAEKVFVTCVIKTIFHTCNKLIHGWCEQENLFDKTLCKSFDKIMKDLNLHANFCIMIYRKLKKTKLPYDFILQILSTAIQIEKEFAINFMPFKDFGYDINDVMNYMEFTADEILQKIGEPEIFKRNSICLSFMAKYHKKHFCEKDNTKVITKKTFSSSNNLNFSSSASSLSQTNTLLKEKNKSVVEIEKQSNSSNPYGQQVFSVDADF